ncbi:hypothetical protein C8Q79DRAFT_661857 [Trametes meyenii]|nr:hypothetical protein C8Q79DRAFT_661857 [Trametes meyenii]
MTSESDRPVCYLIVSYAHRNNRRRGRSRVCVWRTPLHLDGHTCVLAIFLDWEVHEVPVRCCTRSNVKHVLHRRIKYRPLAAWQVELTEDRGTPRNSASGELRRGCTSSSHGNSD